MAKKVLVVDDAAFMRMMLKDILSKNGYEVVGEGVNGNDGFEKYKELKPDIVDGLQCLKKIKEFDAAANVVMCSAMGQQAMVIESIQSGAKDFIVKPFQQDRVLESLAKIK